MRDAMVPEFILQPLVENAIRHGVARRSEAGIVEISARETDSEIILSVADNGPGYRPTGDSGLGISNTQARLKTLFGDAGQLQINGEGDGTVATVRFPIRR